MTCFSISSVLVEYFDLRDYSTSFFFFLIIQLKRLVLFKTGSHVILYYHPWKSITSLKGVRSMCFFFFNKVGPKEIILIQISSYKRNIDAHTDVKDWREATKGSIFTIFCCCWKSTFIFTKLIDQYPYYFLFQMKL